MSEFVLTLLAPVGFRQWQRSSDPNVMTITAPYRFLLHRVVNMKGYPLLPLCKEYAARSSPHW